jgi:oligoribonuclease NrnB/cAMP/cGMP phosphodiesterase (DHH superfamily)
MVQINIEQARKFLDKISSENSVAIAYHNDLDGFSSALSVADYLRKRGVMNIDFFDINAIDGIKNIIKELEKRDFLVICDIAPSILDKDIYELKEKDIFYFDHHQKDVIIPNEVNELRTDSHKPCAMTAFEITGKKDFLSFIGFISDAGWKYEENNDYLNEKLKKFGLELEEAKKIGIKLAFLIMIYMNEPMRAIEYLDKVNNKDDIKNIDGVIAPLIKELDILKKDFEKKKEKIGGVYFYYFEPELCAKGILINEISYNNLDDAFVFATPHKNSDTISLSMRNQSGKIDCADFLKRATMGLENSNAGGHFRAAGGGILKKDLEKFKEKLKNMR